MSYRPTMTIEPKEPIDAKLAAAYRDTMSRPDKRPHRKTSVSVRLSLPVLDLLDEVVARNGSTRSQILAECLIASQAEHAEVKP